MQKPLVRLLAAVHVAVETSAMEYVQSLVFAALK